MEVRKTLNNLEIACFLSLYKTRSYPATADMLSITPRALAQNLKRLEAKLGFDLFLKNDQNLWPTIAGKKYYDFFLARGKDLAISSRLIHGNEPGDALCIGWCDWLGCPEWITQEIKRFKSDHPGMTLSVRQASAKKLKQLLYDGEIDIALTSDITSGSLKSQIYSTNISKLPLYMLISKSYPGISDKPEIADLADLPHISSFMDDMDEGKVIARCLRTYAMMGITPKEISVLPNWESVYAEINMQNGVTFAPANNTVRTHDCFTLVPTGLEIPLIALKPLEQRNKTADLFFGRLVYCTVH